MLLIIQISVSLETMKIVYYANLNSIHVYVTLVEYNSMYLYVIHTYCFLMHQIMWCASIVFSTALIQGDRTATRNISILNEATFLKFCSKV